MKYIIKIILKNKSYIIPIIAYLFTYIPITIVDGKLTLLIWTLIGSLIIEVAENIPTVEISFKVNHVNSVSDSIVDLSGKRIQNIDISISAKQMPKFLFSRKLNIIFPDGVTLNASSKSEAKFISNNMIMLRLKDVANDGIKTYSYALGLEVDHISGTDSKIKCECKSWLIRCLLKNHVTINWRNYN